MTHVLYLLMRNDLPSLNAGKLAAQSAHVANAFVYDMNNFIKPLSKKKSKAYGVISKKAKDLLEDWESETTQGFGTTIVLGATKDQITTIMSKIHHGFSDEYLNRKISFGTVFDPTYPCYIPKEIAEYIHDSDNKYLGYESVFENFVVGENTGIFLRDEMVGAYLFCDKEDPEIQKILSELKLYP